MYYRVCSPKGLYYALVCAASTCIIKVEIVDTIWQGVVVVFSADLKSSLGNKEKEIHAEFCERIPTSG